MYSLAIQFLLYFHNGVYKKIDFLRTRIISKQVNIYDWINFSDSNG